MTCKELCELLIDFVSDDLSPEHRQLVEHHLKCCPPCVAYFESYQATIKLTRKLPCTPPPPQLIERLRAAAQQIKEQGGQGNA
jgi:anti-sigma factor RsiW